VKSGTLRLPRTYISRGILTGVKFDRRYWVFIGAAVFFATVSSGSTLYLASVRKHFLECNSVSAECFMTIGMVPCMVLGILAMVAVMVAIPYIFRQNEKLGVISMILMGLIVLYTALDAVNNISAIMGYYEAYQAAHGILSSTNNVTGNIVGTGESYC
jgi:multisubunit Na+/H+ antiporter MnhB subunit